MPKYDVQNSSNTGESSLGTRFAIKANKELFKSMRIKYGTVEAYYGKVRF